MRDRDIIFISNALAYGGAARVLTLLAKQFVFQGLRIGIFSLSTGEGEYPLSGSILREYASRNGGIQSRIQQAWQIRKLAKSNRNATIIAFEYFVNVWVLIACIGLPNRVIVSERNDPARVGSRFPTEILRKLLYRRAHMLVCQTDEAAAYFSGKINKVVILNPIEPSLPFSVNAQRRRTVVTFCRLERQKNLGMLIRAFKEFRGAHPEYTLEIYGNGSERDKLLALVESLSLSGAVTIMPSRNDVHDVVRDCSMFVLPSDYEGLSNSMIEAMALGLPTICTDCPCGGARMVIEDGVNGLLIPVGDAAALANAMRKVAEDENLARTLSSNAETIRTRLSVEAISDQWLEII